MKKKCLQIIRLKAKILFITTSLPLKCGVEKQKDHFAKRRKQLVPVNLQHSVQVFLKKLNDTLT